jgi:hypothetical protein
MSPYRFDPVNPGLTVGISSLYPNLEPGSYYLKINMLPQRLENPAIDFPVVRLRIVRQL